MKFKEEANCLWFTFDALNSTCSQFESCPNVTASDCKACVTGQKECAFSQVQICRKIYVG